MAVIKQDITPRYAIYNSDCMEVLQKIGDEKIALSIYSPPFGGLFQYSSSERDLSNCLDYDGFFAHYDHVVAQLARITMPGRMSCVHAMDVPTGNTGTDGYRDFPGDIIRMHAEHGFTYAGRHAIWKEPLAVRLRTMAKNLAHRSLVEDSMDVGLASADYLLLFRRKGGNKVPVAHPVGLHDYAGERKIPAEVLKYRDWPGNQIENRYSHWIWRQYASAFWDDIRIGRVLPFRDSKDEADEKHVHPLQLDVIERCVILRSNPGETVLTPFMGVGSEVFGAVSLGRKGVGIELKASYYEQARRNMALVDIPVAAQKEFELDAETSLMDQLAD